MISINIGGFIVSLNINKQHESVHLWATRETQQMVYLEQSIRDAEKLCLLKASKEMILGASAQQINWKRRQKKRIPANQ